MQRNFPYREDIAGVETLQTARTMLRNLEAGIPAGDCDDFTILIGSLAGSIGFVYRLATTQTRQRGYWSHVYPELLVSGRWMAADATNARAPLGWEAPHLEKAVDMDEKEKSGELLRSFFGNPAENGRNVSSQRLESAKKAIDSAIASAVGFLDRVKAAGS